LRALQERDEEIERWLREEVAPTYDEMLAHPERAISSEQWFENIRRRHAGEVESVIELTRQEEADLLEAQAEAARGEFAADAAVEAVLTKYRL
jgi:hypothetical protein